MPVEAILAELEVYIQSQLGAACGQDLSGKEELAVKVGELAARLVLGAMLAEEQEDPVWVECTCGEVISSKQKERRSVVTLAGTQTISRRKYYCPSCGRSMAPTDERLGIGTGSYSPGVVALTCELAACFAYEPTRSFLSRRFGLDISTKQVQRLSVEVGTLLSDSEHKAASVACTPECRVETKERPKRLVVSADGLMVHSDGAWTEMKCASITSEYGRSTIATMERAEKFAELLYLETLRRGINHAGEVVFVSDGAAWIWKMVGHHFPEAVEIVDWYHATQHLWEVANTWYGEGSKNAKAWVNKSKARLMEDGVERLVASIRHWQPEDEQGQRVKRENLHYFRTNSQRMLYATFELNGYNIGSGSVESACKQYGQGRTKLPGMRWKHQGIEAVAHLRSAVLNGRTHTILEAAALAA